MTRVWLRRWLYLLNHWINDRQQMHRLMLPIKLMYYQTWSMWEWAAFGSGPALKSYCPRKVRFVMAPWCLKKFVANCLWSIIMIWKKKPKHFRVIKEFVSTKIKNPHTKAIFILGENLMNSNNDIIGKKIGDLFINNQHCIVIGYIDSANWNKSLSYHFKVHWISFPIGKVFTSSSGELYAFRCLF